MEWGRRRIRNVESDLLWRKHDHGGEKERSAIKWSDVKMLEIERERKRESSKFPRGQSLDYSESVDN